MHGQESVPDPLATTTPSSLRNVTKLTQ